MGSLKQLRQTTFFELRPDWDVVSLEDADLAAAAALSQLRETKARKRST
jgi:hypothetical protein